MGLSISEKIKLPRNLKGKGEFNRLLDSLAKVMDYAAFFIISDSFSRRKNLYKEIKKKLSNPLKLIELKKTSNILEALEAESSKSPLNELFYVIGLDLLLEDLDQNKKKETLDILQNRLDDLVELNRPLIFAIPIHLVALLRTDAADFWEWHQGVFLFEERFEKPELQLHVLTDQFFNLFGGETYRRKRELFALFDSLLKEYQSSKTEDIPLSYIKSLGYIALLFYELGDYKKALECYLQQKKLLEPLADEFAIGLWLNNMGKLYQNLGQYQQAKGMYKRVLKKYKKTFRENYIYRSLILSNIGWIDHLLGDDNEALRHCSHALATIENNFNPHQIHLAPVLNLMGIVYLGLGEGEEGLECFRRVVQICEKNDGLDHPYVAMIMHNIGIVYKNQGKYEDALNYFYRWNEQIENYYGSEHPKMALQIFNVGEVYSEHEDYDKAMKYFKWALQIMQKSMKGYTDPNVGKILCHIGKVLLKQGKIDEAKNYLDSAHEIFQIHLPSDHPFIKDYKTEIEKISEKPKSETQNEPS